MIATSKQARTAKCGFVPFMYALLVAQLLTPGGNIVRAKPASPADSQVTIAPAPQGPLRANFYDTGWLEGDCAYHGASVASTGKVYFSVSTHLAGQWARIYEFDPSTRRVRRLWSVDQIVPDDGSVVQGKIHAPLTERNGEVFSCTHTSWYFADHINPLTGAQQNPYPGGYVFAVNTSTGMGRVVGTPMHHAPVTGVIGPEQICMNGEGLIANIFDSERGLFYVSSWPSGLFAKVDVQTGQASLYGSRQGRCGTVPKEIPGPDGEMILNPNYQRALRTLALDDDGNVYGSNGKGEIWKYDLQQDCVVTMNASMEDATDRQTPETVKHLNMWRTIVWNGHDQAFYGVHWATSWLFRYDPRADTIQPVTAWRAHRALGEELNVDYAQLGLALGPDQTLYGLVHAPPLKKGVMRSVHLITLNLDTKEYIDHGHILGNDDKTLMFAESCAVSPGGDVYTVGWVEAAPELHAVLKEKRTQGPLETTDEAYVMSLVQIPAENLSAKRN